MMSRPFTWFSRLLKRWHHSLEFRLIFALSSCVLIITLVGSGLLIVRQGTLIQQEMEGQATAFARTFAVMGAAVVIDNLFRIQEAMTQYLNDPNILDIDIVDPDGMIVAAKHTDRIGMVLTESDGDLRSTDTTERLSYGQERSGAPFILVTEPLFDNHQPTAWVRLKYSLIQAQRAKREMAVWLIGTSLVIIIVILSAIRITMERISRIFQAAVKTLQNSLDTLSGDSVTSFSQIYAVIPDDGRIESFSNIVL